MNLVIFWLYDVLNVNKIVITSPALHLLKDTYSIKTNKFNNSSPQDFTMDLTMKFPDEVQTGQTYDLEIIAKRQEQENNIFLNQRIAENFTLIVSSLDFQIQGAGFKTFSLNNDIYKANFKLIPLLEGTKKIIKLDCLCGSRYLGQESLTVSVYGNNNNSDFVSKENIELGDMKNYIY